MPTVLPSTSCTGSAGRRSRPGNCCFGSPARRAKGFPSSPRHPLSEDRLARMSREDRAASGPPLLTSEEWRSLKSICDGKILTRSKSLIRPKSEPIRLPAGAFPRSCRFDRRRRCAARVQVPYRLHGREGLRDDRLVTSRRQAGETEVAGQRHLVGNHEIPVARDAVEHAVAGEAEAVAGFDELDHGVFMFGEGDAFRQ